MQLEELSKILRECGIVGSGGAGFPAYAKLNTQADTVILNCAECEPLFQVDRQLLAQYASEIIGALSLVAETLNAERAIVAVKPSYRDAIDAIMPVLAAFPKVSVSYLPEIYPAGDEVVLTYETTGRVVKPGQIPISVGVIVYNVETMLNIHRAIADGVPVTHKYVMVAGEVLSPSVLAVPIGMSAKELVTLCGGATVEQPAYLIGGPMTGRIASPHTLITKTIGAVILLPQDHYIVQRKTVKANIGIKRAMSACCSCRMCTDLCSRNLLGHPIHPQAFMHGISQNKVFDSKPFLDTFYCSQCGLCEMYSCMQGLSPATIIREYRNGLRQNGVMPDKETAEFSGVSDKRPYRTVPVSRLTRRLGLSRYNKPAPLDERVLNPKRLTVALSQSIGAPAVPLVKKGDAVTASSVIASAPENALGVALHAPTNGTVLAVDNGYILIENRK